MSSIPRVKQKREYLEQIKPLLKITNTDQKQMTPHTLPDFKGRSGELKDSRWLPARNARV